MPAGQRYTYSTVGWSVWIDPYEVRGRIESERASNWHNMFDLRCRVASVAYRLGFWIGNRIDPARRHAR